MSFPLTFFQRPCTSRALRLRSRLGAFFAATLRTAGSAGPAAQLTARALFNAELPTTAEFPQSQAHVHCALSVAHAGEFLHLAPTEALIEQRANAPAALTRA